MVDYLLVEQGKTDSIIKKMNDLYPRDVAFAINKSTPELVSYVNERLEELQHSGAFEELYQNYFFVHSDYYKGMIHKDGFTEQSFYSVFLFWVESCLK